MVELVAPTVKSLLLRGSVNTRFLAAIGFERPMHAFMAPVVLGTSRTSEFYVDSQPSPPHAQST